MKVPTKLKNYRQHFEELVDELDGHSSIDIVELEFGEPASEETLRLVQEQLGGPLPWELKAFYRELNGFKVRWVLRAAEELSEELELEVPEDHCLTLLPLLPPRGGHESRIHQRGVLDGWQGTIWQEEADERRLLRPIDCFTDETCAALFPLPGKSPLVQLHNFTDRTLQDTGRSFAQYLALALQSRGFWFWPASLTEESQDREEVEAFRTAMPVIFPDYDDDLFQPPDY